MFQPDWWIYGWLSGASGILNLFNWTSNHYWRAFTSIVVVVGTLETIFLYWSIRHVEQAPLVEHSYKLEEGRNLLLAAASVSLAVSSRLNTDSYSGFISYFRALILIFALIGMVPIIGYSTCFFNRDLPICHYFH
uniref:Uncharacterized protein n=1 Tax=Acrobeloides nanus TaxID=290746 RepID=A0A914C5H4_9BILA